MFEQWHIDRPGAVALGQPAADYCALAPNVLAGFPSYYVIIAMMPCNMLWRWLKEQLEGFAVNGNLYSFWIRGYDDDSSWEKFVEAHGDR